MRWRKAILICLLALGAAAVARCWLCDYASPAPAMATLSDVERAFQGIFDARVACLVWGNPSELEQFYDTSVISGKWALEHEIGRVKCFREWLTKRSIQITSVESTLKLVDGGASGNRLWGSICHNLILTYTHGEGRKPNVMGIRTIHWVELISKGDHWVVRKDWFWDPLGSSLNPQIPALASARREAAVTRGSYNREAAVKYADRYCGVRIGDSDGKYNPKYKDFTYAGGDCTNYVSQVLADKTAGGIPMDGAWYYRDGSATEAWVCAGSFLNHMIYSGRATLLKRGRYAEVAGLVGRLAPGDVIAYEEKGSIKHLFVVVGKDNEGHVVVDSHSADRYHVPWDLGFEADAVFWLLEVNG